ncbi:hypothetical protein B296_00022889 [Ensete ventricosum]|uniref:Uncharacterized protein n=1 Tax=Ensete ventricosum TaxID=4639 RepID=A0A427A9T2_ENSVE|nr:hypothetical protein B296_00022889 [Ensete ventricosum]
MHFSLRRGTGSRLTQGVSRAHKLTKWCLRLFALLMHVVLSHYRFCHVRCAKPLHWLAAGIKRDLMPDVAIPLVSFRIRRLTSRFSRPRGSL